MAEQLYHYMKELDRVIPDSHERGMLIGYAVAHALRNFTEDPGAGETAWQEVRAIYQGLERIVSNGHDSKQRWKTLCRLQVSIDEMFAMYDQGKRPISPLLGDIMKRVFTHPGQYNDILRRKGLQLQDDTLQGQPYRRTVDSLDADYHTVRDAFDV